MSIFWTKLQQCKYRRYVDTLVSVKCLNYVYFDILICFILFF